mmetsp:Transcript_145919/g.269107  ORF Transcript_145919/g.269107 Transcript_145919/m.269107 type:complete len:400 (+) Transcript_145919:27-1226(+)
MALVMIGIALMLTSFACAAIGREGSHPQDVLSSLLLSLQPAAGWQVVANAAGSHPSILKHAGNRQTFVPRVQGRPKMTSLSRQDGSQLQAPLREDRRRLLLQAAAAAAATSLLPRRASATSAALQQLEAVSDYAEAMQKNSEYIVKATDMDLSAKLPATPDYIEIDVDVPLTQNQIAILQPWGKVRNSMKFSDGLSSDDESGIQAWDGGLDLCRGASTGQLRMSQDGKVKPVVLKGKRVLELGSGTGVAGIGAAFGGASSVVMTDANEDVCQLAKKNVGYNKVKGTSVARLRWGNIEDEQKVFSKGPFDIVMAAEVGYEPPELEALFGTIVRCMESARKSGVKSPQAILQVSILEEGEDNADLPVQTRKAYVDAAQKVKLKLANQQEINESERLVFVFA